MDVCNTLDRLYDEPNASAADESNRAHTWCALVSRALVSRALVSSKHRIAVGRQKGHSVAASLRYRRGRWQQLEGNQLGDFARDIGHRIFRGIQAASRSEEGTDVSEGFVRRPVHYWNEQVAC